MKTSSLTTSAFRSLIKSLFVLAAVLPLAIGCTGSSVKPAIGPEAHPAADWELVFSDEFNDPGSPDANKWRYEVGQRRNNEMQYYTEARRENARVEKGVLVIEARNDDWQGHAVTSASLTTRGTFAFRYGKVEVRAKVPTGRGTWPAIWTLGTNIAQVGWPDCGEIDIMEYVGYMPNTIHWNVHTKAYNHKAGTDVGKSSTFDEPWNRFLVYGIEWYADRIDFLVDGTRYMTYANEGSAAAWPFNAEQYLLINLAIGGSWGGRKGVDMALFPYRYEIDDVRIYRHGRAATRTDPHLEEQCLTECLSTWQQASRG